MNELNELEKKGLKEAFGLSDEELFEAKYNLLGLFNALYKIDRRLALENEVRQEGKSDD